MTRRSKLIHLVMCLVKSAITGWEWIKAHHQQGPCMPALAMWAQDTLPWSRNSSFMRDNHQQKESGPGHKSRGQNKLKYLPRRLMVMEQHLHTDLPWVASWGGARQSISQHGPLVDWLTDKKLHWISHLTSFLRLCSLVTHLDHSVPEWVHNIVAQWTGVLGTVLWNKREEGYFTTDQK